MLSGPVQAQYFSAIQSQEAKNQLQPGLYDRVPVSFRTPKGFVMNFSHDESLGLLLMDYIFGYKLGFARDQRTFGDAHGYNFPNAAWSAFNAFTRPVYDRSGKLVPPYQLFLQTQFYGIQVEDIRRAGGITPTFGSDLVLCAGLISMLSNDRVNAVLSASIHKGESDTLDGCIYQFDILLKAHYPMGQVVDGHLVTSPVPLVNMLAGLIQTHPSARLAQFLTE
jgi:hypothetical protein